MTLNHLLYLVPTLNREQASRVLFFKKSSKKTIRAFSKHFGHGSLSYDTNEVLKFLGVN